MQSLGNESDGQKEERQGKRESLPSDPESHKKNSQSYEMSLESYIRQSVGERKMNKEEIEQLPRLPSAKGRL